MRWRAAILGLLLVAVGAARAQDPCECVTCTAKEVPAAVQRGDVAWLRELANGVDPDPWIVAYELISAGERAAALEFARHANGKSVKKLRAYFLKHRRGDSDPDLRKILMVQREAKKTKSWSRSLEAAEGLSGDLDCLVKIVIESNRGAALINLGLMSESLGPLGRVLDAAEAIDWPAMAAKAMWNRGVAIWYAGDLGGGLPWLKRALALSEEMGELFMPMREMHWWIGFVHRGLGEARKALSYWEKSQKEFEEAGDTERAATIAKEIARLPRRDAAGAKGDPRGTNSADEEPLPDLPKGFPFPRGRSRQKYAHIEYSIHLPSDYDPKKKYSLLVAVVGADKDGSLSTLVEAGFVVCAMDGGETITGPATDKNKGNPLRGSDGAPKSPANLDAAVEFACFLRRTLAIPPDRAHIFLRKTSTYCAGRLASTEGLSASTLCFEDMYVFDSRNTLRENLLTARFEMLSACLRKWRVRAVLFTEDFAADWQIADSILGQLREKRISIEVLDRLQLAAWDPPFDPYAYYFYCLKVQEGRFTPGYDLSFSWQDDPAKAMAKMAAQRRPGFAYFFSEADAESKHAKRLQNVVFFDREIRSLGRQLFALKLRKGDHEELFASFGLKSTPAVVTLDPDFVPVTTLERARLTTRKMKKALKDLAKAVKPPK